MFFNSIKEESRLRKEINRLLSEGCQIFTSKLLLRKADVLKTSVFLVYKICHQVSFEKLQLKKILLNFKTSSCNLKIRKKFSKTVCGFSIMLVLKGIMVF